LCVHCSLAKERGVRSACEGGRGRVTGDGVIGLSRSLIYAGVPSVIVSLWTVPDDSTKLLMTEFYKNLQHNPDKAQALRQAMLTTSKQYDRPLNRAAFTLIGLTQASQYKVNWHIYLDLRLMLVSIDL
jgi:CHAT domain-containing protein